jgi:hypothetical protein
LATIRRNGEEMAAIISPGGPVPVREMGGFRGGREVELLSLLESGRFHELKVLYTTRERWKYEWRPPTGSSMGRSIAGRARSGVSA